MIDLNTYLTSDDRSALAQAYANASETGKAIALYQDALRTSTTDDRSVIILSNLASLYLKEGNLAFADSEILRALRITTTSARVWSVKALIEQELANYQGADAAYKLALDFGPNDVGVMGNYAYLCQLLGRHAQAVEIYTWARNLAPTDLQLRFQRSLSLLSCAGDDPAKWREALDEYEIRHFLYKSPMPPTDKPMWCGLYPEKVEPIKSLLIVTEQGIGDFVMMGRYARHLKDRGRVQQVYVLCAEHYRELAGQIEGVDAVFGPDENLPEFTYYVPIMSLLKIDSYPVVTPPVGLPYLRTSGRRYVFPRTGRMRVGLAWQGAKTHLNDRFRSIPPAEFERAFRKLADNIDFYSLQQPEETKNAPSFVEKCEIDTPGRLVDLIGQMDLVVTVDSAPAHIAGALGVRCFTLLPVGSDWRWQTRGNRTRWYPKMQLLRGSYPKQWYDVLDLAADWMNEMQIDKGAA